MDTKAYERRKLIQRRKQSVQVLFEELDHTELDGCKFLCEPYIASASLEDIRHGSKLVLLLDKKEKINFEAPDFDFLVELLYRVHRLDLLTDLGLRHEDVRTKYGNIQRTNMIAFRCLLLSLSFDLTNENLESTLEILQSDADIGRGRLSRIKTFLDLFRLLMKEVKLKHDDFQWLTQMVDLIGRQDLLSKIRQHEESSMRSITFHASIDSMCPPYYDTGLTACKSKKGLMLFTMEEPSVSKYSAQFTCVKEMYPHKESSSPPPNLQDFNKRSGLFGKPYGKETSPKQFQNLLLLDCGASVEHFETRAPDLMDSELLSNMPCGLPDPMSPTHGKELHFSSSVTVQDREQTQRVAPPKPIVSLPPQGATCLGFFEQQNCNDARARDQTDRGVLGGMACGLTVPHVSISEKVKDRKDSEGEKTTQSVVTLPTDGTTLLGNIEDPSSGYCSSERDNQPPQCPRYKMSAEPRGQCIVVNNQTFEKDSEFSQSRTHERRGSNIDADRLMKTFSALKFKTELHNNLSASQLIQLVSETASKDHTLFDCLVLCVLTHGLEGKVIGTDWEPVSIDDLTKYLQASYCRTLAGKPKILILQACQGKKRQLCCDIEEDIVATAARVVRPKTNTGDHGDTADFVIVHSTCPGYTSLRSPTNGAFFIQTLTDVLDQNAERWDFSTILEVVNNKMGRRIQRNDGRHYIQTSFQHSTLKAKIYF